MDYTLEGGGPWQISTLSPELDSLFHLDACYVYAEPLGVGVVRIIALRRRLGDCCQTPRSHWNRGKRSDPQIWLAELVDPVHYLLAHSFFFVSFFFAHHPGRRTVAGQCSKNASDASRRLDVSPISSCQATRDKLCFILGPFLIRPRSVHRLLFVSSCTEIAGCCFSSS